MQGWASFRDIAKTLKSACIGAGTDPINKITLSDGTAMHEENLLYPISTEELERRWQVIRDEMRERKIDVLVMQNCTEHLGGYVKWFTDLPATNGYPKTVLFPLDDEMTLIEQGPFGGVHSIEPGNHAYRGVAKRLLNPSYCSAHYTKHYNSAQAIAEIESNSYRRVGLVATAAMYFDFCDHLRQALASKVEFVDATEFVDHYKAIKSLEEVGRIRRTAAMQDQIIARVAQEIQPGMRDFEVTALAQYLGNMLGSEQGTFNGASAPLGKPSFLHLHRHEQARKLNRGDHLSLLVENNGFGGFYTEIARTFVFGKVSAELSDGFELAKEAQRHTLTYLCPGASCKDVFAEYDAFMQRRGFPSEKRLYAHGQGYDIVERPLVRQDETMVVEENMNIVVHPGFSTKSIFAVVCDNFLLTKGSPERLHATEQKIFEL
jgi:Xaa-Pro aminopeptidase